MSESTKILPFRAAQADKPLRPPANRDTFPRFYKEWSRPALPGPASVLGFSVPPETSK